MRGKQAVERAFSGIQSLLLEMLLGWRGIDAADRGEDPETDAVLTVAQAEHLIATWAVKIWQNRELGEYAPAWDPGSRHSPNTLFAAAMSQGGFALQIPAPELYYELLPVHLVKIHGRRGVKIRGLWYDGPALDPYRSGPSPQGGVAKGKWKIHREPRARRWCGGGGAPVGCRAAAAVAGPDRRPDPRRCLADPDEQAAAHRARPRDRPGRSGRRRPSRSCRSEEH